MSLKVILAIEARVIETMTMITDVMVNIKGWASNREPKGMRLVAQKQYIQEKVAT